MRSGLDHSVYDDHIVVPSPVQISPLTPFKSVLRFQPFARQTKTKNTIPSNPRRIYRYIYIETVTFDGQGSMRVGMGPTVSPKPSEKRCSVYVDACELVGSLRQILGFTKPMKATIVNQHILERLSASRSVDR